VNQYQHHAFVSTAPPEPTSALGDSLAMLEGMLTEALAGRDLDAEIDALERRCESDPTLVRIYSQHYGFDIISDDPGVQSFYLQMRMNGESHNIARMCALRESPRLMTDSVFNEGHVNGRQFQENPFLGHHYRRIAEQAGVSTAGRHYVSGLADFKGDPRAWVSSRAEMKSLLVERGWGARAPST
jgi:hypothetical protein